MTDSTDGSASQAQDAGTPHCLVCGASNELGARYCARCGSGLVSVEMPGTETGHIVYLLDQITDWQRETLLTPAAAQTLLARYKNRLMRLYSASPDTNAAHRASYAGPPAPMPAALSSAVPPPVSVVTPLSIPPAALPAASRPPGAMRRLLQDHALKIVFALAVMFLLSALRSLLAWNWIDAVAIHLLPCVPLGLSAMFWWFGRQTRSHNTWAASVYDSLSALLLGFSVSAVNAGWLGGMLTGWPARAAAATAFTCASAGYLWARRQPAYLHLALGSFSLLLYAMLKCAADASSGDLRPQPVLLFAIPFLLSGAVCLGAGSRWNARWRPTWTLWAHLSVVLAALSAIANDVTGSARPEQYTLLALLAAVIYLIGAQALGQTRMVYLAAGFMTVASLLWLPTRVAVERPAGFGALALAFSALALSLAGYNERQIPPSTALARAYRRVWLGGIRLAAGIAWLHGPILFTAYRAGQSADRALSGALLALACCAFQGGAAVRSRRREWVYSGLASAAVASALLMWLVLPAEENMPTACLAPFLLACSLASVIRRHGKAKDANAKDANAGAENASRPPWRVSVASAALAVACLSAFEGLLRLLFGTVRLHGPIWLLPCLAACLLLALHTRADKSDTERSAFISLFCLTVGLEAAALCGLGWGAPFLFWRLEPARLFGWSLCLLAWVWWLAAGMGARREAAWSDALRTGGLTTGLAAAFVSALGAADVASRGFAALDLCFAALFSLFALDSIRRHAAGSAGFALLTVTLAGVANATHLSPRDPGMMPAWALCALGAAAALTGVGRRIWRPDVARLSAAPLLGGYLLCLCWQSLPGVRAADVRAADVLWTVGGALLALQWLKAAWWSERDDFTYGAAALLLYCALRGMTLVWHPAPVWHALLLLPFLAALYLAGPFEEDPSDAPALRILGIEATGDTAALASALIALPLRRSAFSASVLALCWSTLCGDGYPWGHSAPILVAWTLTVYALIYAALALKQPSPVSVTACSWAASAACIHVLLSFTPCFAGSHASLSWPRFAFFIAQMGLVWIGVLRALITRPRWGVGVAPLSGLVATLALLSAAIGLLTVHTPHQGHWTLITLAWDGVLWFGLWLMQRNERYLHVGALNIFAAWALLLYDRLGHNLALLDLYLLPAGLYLLVIGHLADRRAQAQWFRWAGLLTALTPAFMAADHGAGPVHTVLFLLECLLCVLWGIGRRLRAFVSAGLAYAALYCSSIMLGRMENLWGTFTALGIGLGLLVVGFYILTHRAMMQRWADAIEGYWETWS